MFSSIQSNELVFLQEGYSKAAMLIASEKHEEAEFLMNDLIHRVQMLKPRSADSVEEEQYGKVLSECLVNLASCLFNREDCEDSFDRIRQLLEQAIELDSQNHWAYYNFSSYLYRTSSYRQALQNIHCCLSCLYLLKAVLSRDLQNRNREIDLGRAIGYCQNNLKARLARLLMQIKQSRWKMAVNQVELALEGQHSSDADQLEQLKTMLLTAASGSNNTQLNQVRSFLKHAIELISKIPPQKVRLQASVRVELEKAAILKEIDDKMVEFNEVFRQVNELGSSQNLFMLKAIHRTNKTDKKIHIISNAVHPAVRQQVHLAESTPLRPNSVELQAKVIERMNESKKSLTESKGYGQSLFELTKSQNLENSNKYLPGSLLSSLIPTAKPFRVLPSEVQQLENQNETLNDNSSIRKVFDIQAIQSQIQPLPEHESALLSGFDAKLPSNVNQEDDLLLDSLYDRDFKKNKPSQVAKPAPLPKIKQEELSSSSIYPLTEASAKVLELVLLRADFRQEIKQKLVNIYAHLEYNSGFIDTFKFRSRQVTSQGVNDVEWGESLGFIKLAEEPKSMLVKLFKSEPYYYNDKFLGEGEIEVTAVGIIKIPLYLNIRNVGSVSIRLLPGEQGLNSSFKRSHTSNSNFSSSMKSESQSSQHS